MTLALGLKSMAGSFINILNMNIFNVQTPVMNFIEVSGINHVITKGMGQ
jgi:hypothetical protein